MTLHSSAFEHLLPTPEQQLAMDVARSAAAKYANVLEQLLPDGADKTYVLRKVRETAMWANVAILRHADGSPRRESKCENPA